MHRRHHFKELVEVLDATWKQMTERLEESGTDAKINVLGRYSFTTSVPREGLRPLRDPDAVELDDDDDGRED
ncbi:hypothetical protein ACFVW2_33055 [Streptomyces sp. NPDC058171]